MKSLRQSAAEATNGTLVPSDIDEVTVEEEEDPSDAASISIRASLCCDFKHELLNDLREAVDALPDLKAVRAEISTLGTRMVNVFVISGPKCQDPEGGQPFVESIRQAFRSVLDKFYASEEFSSRNTSSKRRRVSFFTSSSSSLSLGDVWWWGGLSSWRFNFVLHRRVLLLLIYSMYVYVLMKWNTRKIEIKLGCICLGMHILYFVMERRGVHALSYVFPCESSFSYDLYM